MVFLYDPLPVLLIFMLGMVLVAIGLFMPAPGTPAVAWNNLAQKQFWVPIWRQKSLYTATGWKLYAMGWALVLLAAIIKLLIVFT